MSEQPELENAAILLGCPEDTPLPRAEKLYRRLAKQFHPDVDASPLAEARMRDLNTAITTFRRRDERDLEPIPRHGTDTSIFSDDHRTVVVRATEDGVAFRVFIDGRERFTLLRYPAAPSVLYARDMRGRVPAVIGDYQAWIVNGGVIEPYAFEEIG